MRIKIRKAVRSDSDGLVRLIIELAEFEKLKPPDKKAKKRLLNDAFSKTPPFKIYVAESGNELIGYAFYFFTYSTFLAKKSLYLEDIYITPKFRKSGIGKRFFKILIKEAKENKCGRIEWAVLDWNINAIRFYENLGAKWLNDWKYYRLIL